VPELKLCRLFWNQFHIRHYFLTHAHLYLEDIFASFGFIIWHTPSFRFYISVKCSWLIPRWCQIPHTDLRPVLLVLYMNTDTESAAANNPLNLDGFVSPCHPHAVTQIFHLSTSFLPLHIPFEESWGRVNLKPSWDTFLGTLFIHYLFSYMYYLNAISDSCVVISRFFFYKNTPKPYTHLHVYYFF